MIIGRKRHRIDKIEKIGRKRQINRRKRHSVKRKCHSYRLPTSTHYFDWWVCQDYKKLCRIMINYITIVQFYLTNNIQFNSIADDC